MNPMLSMSWKQKRKNTSLILKKLKKKTGILSSLVKRKKVHSVRVQWRNRTWYIKPQYNVRPNILYWIRLKQTSTWLSMNQKIPKDRWSHQLQVHLKSMILNVNKNRNSSLDALGHGVILNVDFSLSIIMRCVSIAASNSCNNGKNTMNCLYTLRKNI